MNTTIFIPKKINVGFQNREGTYTGKLAYIIYFDEKGVLRKERSWEGWRDSKIEAVIADNEPTSGFVLNKKVGGYDTGWSHRQTYTRVYDPRGFEFEITIENLLYILENTSSIKGKGLEGEFVYGWSGKDLILIPTSSPDYTEIMKYSEILSKKEHVKTKDLILGGTYRTKTNEEWIYMGRFDYYDTKSRRVYYGSGDYSYDWVYDPINKGKHHFFVQNGSYNNRPYLNLLTLKSLGNRFIEIVSSDCVENYADLYTQLEERTAFSPHDISKDEYVLYTLEEFTKYANSKVDGWYGTLRFLVAGGGSHNIQEVNYNRDEKMFFLYGDYEKTYGNWYGRKRIKNVIGDGSVEAVFNQYKPVYRNEYLANGKFYRKVER